MSQEEITRLSQEEEELRLLLEEKRKRRLDLIEAERLRVLHAKRITLTIASIDRQPYNQIHVFKVKSLAREDILETWKKLPGRRWGSYDYTIPQVNEEYFGLNTFPMDALDTFFKLFENIPNSEIVWAEGVKEAWELIKSAPAWLVDVEESKQKGKYFTILKGLKAKEHPRGIQNRIPGCRWDDETNHYLIPVAEGWRIWDEMKSLTEVLYTDEAKGEILNQIEIRNRLNEIAAKKDSDFVFKKLPDVMVKLALLNKANLPFQNVGVEFGYEAKGRFVLGDSTGLGKTRQELLLALIFINEAKEKGEHFSVVCNVKASNIENWTREIKLITDMDPLVVTNKPTDKHSAIVALALKSHHFFIISHDTLGTYEEDKKDKDGHVSEYFWAEMFKDAGVDMMIVDESHKIKSTGAYRSKAAIHASKGIPHICLASATPVLNRPGEWFVPLHMIDAEKFRNQSDFEYNYTIDGKIPRNVEHLHEMLAPIFLRRLKKDVLPDLPPINRIREYRELSPKGQEDYQSVLEGFFNQNKIYNPHGYEVGKEVFSFLAQYTRLIQVCAAEMVEHTVEKATELEGRGIIFTRFKGPAYRIAQALGNEAVCVVDLKETGEGDIDFKSLNVKDKDRLIESVRHDERVKYIVIVADPSAGFEGLNMEFCDWVIFNDPFWGPAAYDQCEGRAYGRLSNPHKIDSIYMHMKGRIIEILQEMNDEKLGIVDATVDGVERARVLSLDFGRELMQRVRKEMGL